jgi:hypothetical protein
LSTFCFFRLLIITLAPSSARRCAIASPILINVERNDKINFWKKVLLKKKQWNCIQISLVLNKNLGTFRESRKYRRICSHKHDNAFNRKKSFFVFYYFVSLFFYWKLYHTILFNTPISSKS